MTFLSALVLSLVLVGIWALSEGIKAPDQKARWTNIGICLCFLLAAFLLSVGPIPLAR